MGGLGLIAGILLLVAILAFLFRVRGSKEFAQAIGRGATTARLLWAFASAFFAWLVDNDTNAAWGSPIGSCWVSAQSGWSFSMLSVGRGAARGVPLLCDGVDHLESMHTSMWTVPIPLHLILLTVAVWAGAASFGWWKSLDLGTHEGTLARDLPMHSLRGLVFTLFAALLLWWVGLGSPWPLLIAGALCGPIYYAARLHWPLRPVEAGEWSFGAAQGAALLFSVAFT